MQADSATGLSADNAQQLSAKKRVQRPAQRYPSCAENDGRQKHEHRQGSRAALFSTTLIDLEVCVCVCKSDFSDQRHGVSVDQKPSSSRRLRERRDDKICCDQRTAPSGVQVFRDLEQQVSCRPTSVQIRIGTRSESRHDGQAIPSKWQGPGAGPTGTRGTTRTVHLHVFRPTCSCQSAPILTGHHATMEERYRRNSKRSGTGPTLQGVRIGSVHVYHREH